MNIVISVCYYVAFLLLLMIYRYYEFYVFKKNVDINKFSTYKEIKQEIKKKSSEYMGKDWMLVFLGVIGGSQLAPRAAKHILLIFNIDLDNFSFLSEFFVVIFFIVVFICISNPISNLILKLIIKKKLYFKS